MIVVTLVSSSILKSQTEVDKVNEYNAKNTYETIAYKDATNDATSKAIYSGTAYTSNTNQTSKDISQYLYDQQKQYDSLYGFSAAQADFYTQQAQITNTSTYNSISDSMLTALGGSLREQSAILDEVKLWIATATGILTGITTKIDYGAPVDKNSIGETIAVKTEQINTEILARFSKELADDTKVFIDKFEEKLSLKSDAQTDAISDGFMGASAGISQTLSENATEYSGIFAGINRIFDNMFAYGQSRGLDLQEIFTKVENGDYSTIEDLNKELFSDGLSTDVGEIVMFFASVLPLLQHFINTQYAKTYQGLQWIVNKDVSPSMLNWSEYIDGYNRGAFTDTYVVDKLQKMGYSDDLIQHLFVLGTIYPTSGDISELYRRGDIDKQRFENLLEGIGFSRGFKEEMESLAWYQPPVQDVIRFAVRDVFNPQIVEEGGLFNDMPQEFVDLAKKSGLKPDMAKLYWGSHWFLPSIQQGFEMLHRGVINNSQLDSLMKAADIAPNWRDKLSDIAYSVPTRVDTRRMFEDGVIDEDTLGVYLRAFGYNSTDAENIKQWYIKRKLTVQDRSRIESKKITLGLIGRAFKLGIIPRREAVTKLTGLGYMLDDVGIMLSEWDSQIEDANTIDYTIEIKRRYKSLAEKFYLRGSIDEIEAKELLNDSGLGLDESEAIITLINLEKELSRKDAIITEVKKLYIGYELSDTELYSFLPLYGFTNGEILLLLDELKPFRQFRKRDLTRSDIKKAYSMHVIDRQTMINQYRGLGYSDKDIEIILQIETEGIDTNVQ